MMIDKQRIESLVNQFGETINDLPQSDGLHHVYDSGQRAIADKMVFEYHKMKDYVDIIDVLHMHQSFICYLVDIINRMTTALETAVENTDQRKE